MDERASSAHRRVLQDSAEMCARIVQAIAGLQQTRTDSRRIRAQSRATRFSLNAPGIARFCECGSFDVYSTLITPQVTYRRCRRCGNIWPWDAGDEPEQESL
jgi:hypothetical protein